MCGIVGATAARKVSAILVEGLHRLEYRGYDSAGVAITDEAGTLHRVRRSGKVAELESALAQEPLAGFCGIAHTRWATHGPPVEANAHPHVSGEVAVVHNGIIENYESLREELQAAGYTFTSETDTETIAHLVHKEYQQDQDLLAAVRRALLRCEGAYAVALLHTAHPGTMIAARKGSPLIIGLGMGENFIASDQLALLHVTDRFVFLDDGDFAELTPESLSITNAEGAAVERSTHVFEHGVDAADRGGYRHYMLKEIHEQPDVIDACLTGRISADHVLENAFGEKARAIFDRVKAVQVIACGTSYHAGLVAKYWIESLVGIPCLVEVASEFRYRESVVLPDSLFLTISQSGETADTLAALRDAKNRGYLASLTICNVPSSSLVRESDLALMTMAGPEIGVASTKAFTTQLTGLMLLTLVLGRRHGLDRKDEARIVNALRALPQQMRNVLTLDDRIRATSEHFAEKHHTLFLGRGPLYPIAMEGALKLKEISYIHAEAYPAGELKHGPLALVDHDMPVVTVAPNNELLEKLKSNLQEVRARGGELFVFADKAAGLEESEGCRVIELPHVETELEALLYTLPLQLLSYHVAVLKGTDVDQPRNLAKSVTVE